MSPKCIKWRLTARLRPDPLVELKRSTKPFNRGLGEDMRIKERRREKKGKGGREGKEGKGEKGKNVVYPQTFTVIVAYVADCLYRARSALSSMLDLRVLDYTFTFICNS